MRKRVGIWLDFNEANIIELGAGGKKDVKITTVPSGIEHYHPKGGARSKTPYGPMDQMSEKTYLERRKAQEKAYFKKLMEAVKDADDLFIFGPAEAREGLEKAIRANNNFRPRLWGSERVDYITQNQKVAKVRDFFSERNIF
ncbi:MAG TPA: hypothetical protein ENJ20_01375 [Bacteroidetes bacterium]|nr:hypothetical protein [Bacteroidota bacterium]